MSLVAGVFSLLPNVAPAPALCGVFRISLSRTPGLEPVEHRDDHVCLLSLNVGAFGPGGIQTSARGSTTIVAGEPLLDPFMPGLSRLRDVATLHEALDDDDVAPLARTRGEFTLVHYDPRWHLVRLVGDRLGLRPLYYWTDGKTLAFSSALRLLESARRQG